MADEKVPSGELKVVEKKTDSRKKTDWTVKRILTTVIIVVLAFLMIGGSFYYIFAPGFRDDPNAFGNYDGTPVRYEANSVFYNTLMSDGQYQQAATSGDYNTIMQCWYKAYQGQVMYVALTKLAEKANIPAPQDLVNRMILDSGVYNGEDGKFSEQVYNDTPASYRTMTYQYIESVYPYQKVVDDYSSVITSDAEKSFVVGLASDTRNFDYFIVDYNAYPDEEARKTGSENEELFLGYDLFVISCSEKEKAEEAWAELEAGKEWKEVVSSFSQDSYAVNDGKINERLTPFQMKKDFSEASEADKVFALEEGEYTEPVALKQGYAIYKLEAKTRPDFSNAETLSLVKSFIYENEPDTVKPFIEKSKEDAALAVADDFEKAATDFGSGIVTVSSVPNNPANSQLFANMNYSDFEHGKLAQAAGDMDFSRDLYTKEIGYVTGPVTVDGGYIFVKIAGESKEEAMSGMLSSYYDYYGQQFPLSDLQNAIFASDKFEDNFSQKFMEILMNQMSVSSI